MPHNIMYTRNTDSMHTAMNEFRRPLRRRRLYEAPLTTATTMKTSPIIGGTTTVILGGGRGGRRLLRGDDGDVNILLLVGAVGAGVSLLLLVIGLCRARGVHRATAGNVGGEAEERRKTTTSTKKCTNKDVATFEPGKNNPGSRHGWFRRPSGIDGNKTTASGSPLRPPPPPAFPPTDVNSRPNTPNQYHTDDDESNADFVLARAALLRNDNDGNDANNDGGGESLEDGDMESLGGESFGYTVDGESSLAASRNATKYINGVAAAAAAIPGTTTNEDSAIGAGGISSFTNDRGIFRWNENGTKMVYTPTAATLRKTGGGAVVGEEQNGFIFDERKKKWVVKEKIVGGKTSKNVSFPSSTALLTTSTESEHIIKRVRSNESTAGGSVISGMSEFTYDHIGRGNNTTTTTTTTNDNGRKVITTKMKKAASPNTPDETEEGFEISSSMGITLTPLTPATVYDDTNDNDTIDDIDQLLLLRVGPTTLSTPTRNEHSSNNNDDDLDDDDGSTSMMTGFTDIYESNTALSGLTNIVTPERNGGDGNRYTTNNDDDCGSSVRTGDPGRIIPKTRKKFESQRPRQQQQSQQPSSSYGGGAGGGMFFGAGRLRSVITAAPPSMLKISEDTPFDEDIPFDERSKVNNNNDNDGQLLHHRPELKDDDDDEYEDDESQGSANSEHVLKDLDSLSKFMYERKRSEKKKRGRVVGGGARGSSGGWDDSRTSSARFGGPGRTITSSSTAGRKSSFGSRGI